MATQQVNERLAASRRPGPASGWTRSAAKLIESGELRGCRGGLAARRDLEPGDLREGDPRRRRLRRPARGARARGPGRTRRSTRRSRSRTSRTPATCCARSTTRPTAPTASCRSRSTPTSPSTPRRRSSRRASTGRRVDRPNLMIKIPGTDEGVPGDRAGDLRGAQHQRHAAVLGRGVRARRRGLHLRASSAASTRASRSTCQSVASFFVSRVDTEVDKRLEAPATRSSQGTGRPRQRARRLPALQGDLPGRALRDAARRRARGPAPAVGVDRREEPELPRHHVRRRAGRRRTRSTRCRWRRCTPPPTTARSKARPSTIDPTADLRALAEAGIDLDEVTAKLLARRHRRVRRADRQAARGHRAQARGDRHRRPPTIRPTSPTTLEPRDRRARRKRAREEDVARRIWQQGRRRSGRPAGSPRSPTGSAG